MQLIEFVTHYLSHHEYGFALKIYSLIFAALSLFTLMVVGKYSKNYLKGEVGENRFWALFSFFALGMFVCCFAKNLKTFYIGWEIVGLCSFFLIGFYRTNARSIENSLIALANYKICDLFFVMAVLLEEADLHTESGLCLILATLAKSAQLPFSSWLYRSLEGPTPSSTLFYGGLSLHLGAFVLLQFSSLWDHSDGLRIFLGTIGLSSALFGFFAGSVRSDLKTSFAFASISQVGLIYCELAFGFYHLALWHIVGHNLLRTWNYLRGMSFFDEFFSEDYHGQNNGLIQKFFSLMPKSLFYHSMNNFYLDRFSIMLRKIGLIIFSVLSVASLVSANHIGSDTFAVCSLAVGLAISIILFIENSIHPIYFFIGLIFSQILVLLSVHIFLHDDLELLYLTVSFIALALLSYSLMPALALWKKQKGREYTKKQFLGLANKFKYKHLVFLVSAIIVTGSPGTFHFFIQEGILDEMWTKSHLFLVVTLISMTLNTVHTFKIGQAAFLGDSQT